MNGLLKLGFASLLLFATAVFAEPIGTDGAALGDSGWKVSGPSFYELNISVDGQSAPGATDKWVAITISKNFYYGSDPTTGLFPGIELQFVLDDTIDPAAAATRIIIQSEGIYNGTGDDWQFYQWSLYQHEVAQFNQALTNPSNTIGSGGFYTGPYMQSYWFEDTALNVESLWLANGLVAAGESFFPGTGPGSLVIDVDPMASVAGPAAFSFVQSPMTAPMPEPATVSLLLVGALLILRRGRILV